MLDETDFDTGELGRQNVKTIVAVNAAVLRQSFSAGHVLHRERKRDRSLRVLVLQAHRPRAESLQTNLQDLLLCATLPTLVKGAASGRAQRRGIV